MFGFEVIVDRTQQQLGRLNPYGGTRTALQKDLLKDLGFCLQHLASCPPPPPLKWPVSPNFSWPLRGPRKFIKETLVGRKGPSCNPPGLSGTHEHETQVFQGQNLGETLGGLWSKFVFVRNHVRLKKCANFGDLSLCFGVDSVWGFQMFWDTNMELTGSNKTGLPEKCGSKLHRAGKLQVLVHVSTSQNSNLEFRFFRRWYRVTVSCSDIRPGRSPGSGTVGFLVARAIPRFGRPTWAQGPEGSVGSNRGATGGAGGRQRGLPRQPWFK